MHEALEIEILEHNFQRGRIFIINLIALYCTVFLLQMF